MEVGDKVKVIARNPVDCHEFELGGVGRIESSADNKGRFRVQGVGCDDYWRCHADELEAVSPDTPISAVSRPLDLWED